MGHRPRGAHHIPPAPPRRDRPHPQKRFSGTGGSDPALSATGRGQAAAAAGLLAARGTVEAVVSSPLRRCRETAEAAAGRLGLDIRVEDGLREADFGAWEGLTFAEVRERHPGDLAAWLRSTKAAPSGGGESFAEVSRRVAVTRDKLLARYASRTVLLVTHVTPIKTLVRLALGAPPESLYRMELSPHGGVGGRVLRGRARERTPAERHVAPALRPFFADPAGRMRADLALYGPTIHRPGLHPLALRWFDAH